MWCPLKIRLVHIARSIQLEKRVKIKTLLCLWLLITVYIQAVVDIGLSKQCLALGAVVIPITLIFLGLKVGLILFLLSSASLIHAESFLGVQFTRKEQIEILSSALSNKKVANRSSVYIDTSFSGKILNPIRRRKADTISFHLQLVEDGQGERLVSPVIIFLEAPEIAWQDSSFLTAGTVIRVKSRTKIFNKKNKLSKYEKRLLRSGIVARGYVKQVEIIKPIYRQSIIAPHLLELFDLLNYTEAASLLIGLGLASPDSISPGVYQTFRVLGLAHILVFSGYHLGVIFFLARYLSRWLLAWSYSLAQYIPIAVLATLIGGVAAIGYTIFVGLSPPIVRALYALMVIIAVNLSFREASSFIGLASAALVISFLYPGALLTAGPQLTFAALVGILIGIRLRPKRKIQKIEIAPNRIKKFMDNMICYAIICVTAWLATAPIVVYWFEAINLLAPLWNFLFALPLCLLLVVVGAAALVLTICQIPGAQYLLLAVYQIIECMFQILIYLEVEFVGHIKIEQAAKLEWILFFVTANATLLLVLLWPYWQLLRGRLQVPGAGLRQAEMGGS